MQRTPTLELADAQFALDHMRDDAATRGLCAVVAVADPHGELIGLLRMDGARLPSIVIAANKAYTAAREQVPSKHIGTAARHPETGFDLAYFGDPRMIGWGGGVPVIVDGACLGAVAVSGLPEHIDIEIATAAAAALVERLASPRP